MNEFEPILKTLLLGSKTKRELETRFTTELIAQGIVQGVIAADMYYYSITDRGTEMFNSGFTRIAPKHVPQTKLEPPIALETARAISRNDVIIPKPVKAFQQKFGTLAETPAPEPAINLERGTLTKTVLAILQDGELTAREISEKTGVDVLKISTRLSQLKNSAHVKSRRIGAKTLWSLVIKKPTIAKPEPNEVAEPEKTQKEQVREALTLEAVPYTVIAERCGLNAKRVSSVLSALYNVRQAKKHVTPNGICWSLPSGVMLKTPVEPVLEQRETPEPLEMPATQHDEPHETAEPEVLEMPAPEVMDELQPWPAPQVLEEQPIAPKEPTLEQQTLEQTELPKQQTFEQTAVETFDVNALIDARMQELQNEQNRLADIAQTIAHKQPEPEVDPRAQTAFAADLELQAIASIMTALSPLDYATSDRVMQYVYDRMCIHAE
jgi:hypothetical protein